MKKSLLSALLCMMTIFCCYGESLQYTICVPIKEKLSHRELFGGFDICNPSDSSVIAKSCCYTLGKGVSGNFTSEKNKILLRIYANEEIYENGVMTGKKESDEYSPEWMEVNLTAGVSEINLPDVFLGRQKHMSKKLDEVTVTASKVMFYHKGDTLVYNADAFVLAEGSTLDALLHQMPGVELHKNGIITVNGRHVHELLLNGKDLFNGNNELMLDNLGAYAVKDIAVYNKSGRLSQLMSENLGDTKYVMDVRLKRQYSFGWIVNAEGGYGSRDRYLGKLFGMWFSDNVSMSLYGGANNLTDASKPGKSDGAWSRDLMGEGVISRQYGGITYNAQGYADKWVAQGSADVSHTDETVIQNSSTEHYFNTGSVFQSSLYKCGNKSVKLQTDHSLYLKLNEKSYLEIYPEFNYLRNSIVTDRANISSNERIDGLYKDLLPDVYEGSEALRASIISRETTLKDECGHTASGRLKAESYTNVKSTGVKGLLSVKALGRFYSKLSDSDVSRDIFANLHPEAERNVYLQKLHSPDNRYEAEGEISYAFLPPSEAASRIPLTYRFIHKRNEGDAVVYQERMSMSPEAAWSAYSLSRDPDLSYNECLTENIHDLEVGWSGDVAVERKFASGKKTHRFMFNSSAGVKLLDRNYVFGLESSQPPADIHKTQFQTYGQLNIHYVCTYITEKRIYPAYWQGNFKIEFLNREAPMSAMTDRPATDPLRIYSGNRLLKNPSELRSSLSLNKTVGNGLINTLNVNFTEYFNDIALGLRYDMNTGVSDFRSYNVSGNRHVSGSYSLFIPFASGKRFGFTTQTSPSYTRSVDFSGTDAVGELNKRTVNKTSIGEMLKLDWHNGKCQFSLYADGKVNLYRSNDMGFSNFTSWIYHYGVSTVLNLPYNWGVSSDLTLYNRRGFADQRLNTTDVLWNARVTKSILKGALVFVADGYDLLHQLSNVTYTVNAQARTETVSNVIPNYILFHVQWHFNHNPKR